MRTAQDRLSHRLLFVVWLGWLASVAWNWLIFRLWILHPPWQPLALLFAAQIISGAWLAMRCSRRIWQGCSRQDAWASLLLGLAPLWSWAALISYVLWTTNAGYIPFNVLIAEGIGVGASFGDLEARLRYRDRCEGERCVMFHSGWSAARDQAAAIDRHLARMEALLGEPARGKAHWIRGPLWGRSGYHFQGLAMSDPEEPPPNSPDGLTIIDRHELAHFAIEQLCDHEHRPPFLLVEGWAESQSGYQPGELAQRAWRDQECGATLSLAELTGDLWYCRDKGPVYTQGGPLVDYLLRTYGGPKFLELYRSCRPHAFAADVQRVLGVDLEQLDRDYWADIERQCPPLNVALRTTLAALPLAEGVDPGAYRTFVREFSAASAAREARQDGVCEVTIVSERNPDGETPRREEQRVQFIRDGSRQGVVNHWRFADEAIVCGPEESFCLRRAAGEERWEDSGSAFAPLARLQHLSKVYDYARRWDLDPVAAFSDTELLEFRRGEWRATGIHRTERDGQALVELELKRVRPEAFKVQERTCRFLPEQGWIFDGDDSIPLATSPNALRTLSRVHYDFSDGAAPRRIAVEFEYYNATTGERVSTARQRIARRPLDEGTRRRLQSSSYPRESRSILAALPIPLPVIITWTGAVLSLIVGLGLRVRIPFRILLA